MSLNGQLSLLGQAHLGGKGRAGFPSGRSSGRSDLFHHSVDLLERKTLGLPHEEVGVELTNNTERTPDKEHLGSEVTLVLADHVRGDDSDDAVPEPVGSGRKTDTSSSNGQREDLTDTNPSSRSPCGGEKEDIDADEGDLRLHDGRVVALGDTEDGGDVFTNPHSQGTVDEERSSTESFNGPE